MILRLGHHQAEVPTIPARTPWTASTRTPEPRRVDEGHLGQVDDDELGPAADHLGQAPLQLGRRRHVQLTPDGEPA